MRKDIKSISFVLAFVAIGLCMSCNGGGGKDKPVLTDSTAIDMQPVAKGDSAVYGLACEGCTDSVVVFLPNSGGDPDTFEIINAKQKHKVFGIPKIGNKLAIMINPEDKEEATMVINIDELSGSWCYMAKPQFRDVSKLSKRAQRRMMADMPDSMRKSLLVPKEFGIELKRNYSAQPIGMMPKADSDMQSPVEYPEQKRYEEWRLFNGKVLLIEGKNMMDSTNTQKPAVDTAEIVMLMKDSLVLKFSDGPKSYYRQKGKK